MNTVTIPDGISTVEEDAFYECNNLTKIIIRGKRTYVDTDFASYCSDNLKIYCYKALSNYHYLSIYYNCSILDIYVNINKDSIRLNMGYSTQLKATVYNATNANVVWSVANSTIASVSKTGYVTAKKSGTTKVTAKYVKDGAQYTDTCIVYVNKPYITGSSDIYLKQKTKYLVHNRGKKTVKWSVKNKKIATIDNNGKLTAKKMGSTSVIANVGGIKLSYKIYVYGPNLGYTDCEITVGFSKYNYVYPSSVYKKVTWKSRNSRIVSVNKKGEMKAKRPGSCWIYAKTAGKTLKCFVVSKKNEYKCSSVDKLSDVSNG